LPTAPAGTTVPLSIAHRLEDRHEVGHLAPLAGVGHGAVDALQSELLVVETDPSEALSTGDYEAELRAATAEAFGPEQVTAVFPDHEQFRVVGHAGS